MTQEANFVYRFEPGRESGAPPLLLLHGTGGDENDIIDLGANVSPGSALLSPRGRVLERGMPRFFRRLGEGVFDEEDVRRRANELADFVEEARKRHGIGQPIALGYSNGANIAAAVMLLRPETLAGGILFRAMAPFADPPHADLAGRAVLMTSGRFDPIAPPSNAGGLAATLREAGAAVSFETLPASHQLTRTDLDLARDWIKTLPAQALA